MTYMFVVFERIHGVEIKHHTNFVECGLWVTDLLTELVLNNFSILIILDDGSLSLSAANNFYEYLGVDQHNIRMYTESDQETHIPSLLVGPGM